MYTPEELDQAATHYMDHGATQDSGTMEYGYGSVERAFIDGAKWTTQQLTTNSQQRTAQDLGLTPEEAKDYGPKDTDPDADQG